MPGKTIDMNSYFTAMRLERWPRSMAIFVGTASFFFLHKETLPSIQPLSLILRIIGSFLLTWAISTANYIVNEIVDAPYDAHHPTKHRRPLLTGEIRKGPFILAGIGLTLTSLTLAYIYFPLPFFLSLASLLAAGFIYNIPPVRTKDIPFLDSISESANNPIRFFIGWFAFASQDMFPPAALLICWWSFGNFLLVAKRLSELRFLKEKAGDYRASLRKYSKYSRVFGMGLSTAVFLTTYIYFSLMFKLQYFLYLSPFLVIFIILIFRKTLHENEVMEEPERLLKYPNFAAYTLLLLFLYFLAFLVEKVGY